MKQNLILLGIVLGWPIWSSGATGPRPGPAHVVTVQTRELKVEFTGDRAWTMQRIEYQGAMVADKIGYYGTVFSPEGGKWVGTGHNEGGVEKVEQVALTVDGQSCALTNGVRYRAERAVLHKTSSLGPIQLEATYVVLSDALLERHRYEVTEDVKIGILYAFMHPWLPGTTEWLAEKADGSSDEGKFDNRGDFKLRADVKWTGIFDPQKQRAMLAWYPAPLVGQAIKTAYWDKTAYHKLYNQIYSHAAVAKGAKLEAAVIIRGVEADGEHWKAAIKALAADTDARYQKGEFKF